ncbi:hypothetical protein LWI28_013946 [Acer negundo]|uniref:Ribosomal protein S14 n=1 Tax=Acer negundo TaxID=4023 RepID=A0AAD5JH27_ACENE|nr:hypothetical protein LWI28_013946 [Acer negundo]
MNLIKTIIFKQINVWQRNLVRIIGGMKVKAERVDSSTYATMLAAQDVSSRCKELGITALHIKLRATGGKRPKHLALVPNPLFVLLLVLE